MRVCEQFDQYRDGELSAAQRDRFKAHLEGCADCRSRTALLDNLVRALRTDSTEVSFGFAERTARRAFRQPKSWDAQVVSWLRPAPALAALVAMFFLFSSLWLIHGSAQVETPAYGEYEALVNESYSLSPGSSANQVRGDDDLLGWLEQEGGSR